MAAEPGEWSGIARREAAAILSEVPIPVMPSRDLLVDLLAMAWVQGSIYGDHETLGMAERAFAQLKAELS